MSLTFLRTLLLFFVKDNQCSEKTRCLSETYWKKRIKESIVSHTCFLQKKKKKKKQKEQKLNTKKKKKKKSAARKTVKSYRDWHKSDNKNDIKCYYYDKSEGIWRCGRYVYLVCLKLDFTLVKNGCRCIEIKARLLSTKSSRFWTLAETWAVLTPSVNLHYFNVA